AAARSSSAVATAVSCPRRISRRRRRMPASAMTSSVPRARVRDMSATGTRPRRRIRPVLVSRCTGSRRRTRS
ncbi:hypothetical protein LTR66_017103, partial [Elasticomyces elasticus]